MNDMQRDEFNRQTRAYREETRRLASIGSGEPSLLRLEVERLSPRQKTPRGNGSRFQQRLARILLRFGSRGPLST